MSYNVLFADSFKYGLLFGKDIKPGDDVSISVLDKDDVVLAVKKAYIDMSPRTFKNENEDEKQALDSEKKKELFEELANKIADYMKDGTNDFDAWHNKLCERFIVQFGEILNEAGKNPKDATYGKAQKIVNMTFKYLYCYDDADKYYDRFVPCHMALDSYILSWFFDWYSKEYNKGKKRNEKITKSGKNSLPKWSHLKYEKDKTDIVPQYKEIQDAISQYLKKENNDVPSGTPPIEAEFVVWYNERNK